MTETSRANSGGVLRHGKDMLKNALSDTAHGQTQKKGSNFAKFHILVWMINTSNKRISNHLENCQKFARKWS